MQTGPEKYWVVDLDSGDVFYTNDIEAAMKFSNESGFAVFDVYEKLVFVENRPIFGDILPL
jgi:hypothetical protein